MIHSMARMGLGIAAAIATVVLASCAAADVATPVTTPAAAFTPVPTRSGAATAGHVSAPPASAEPSESRSATSAPLVVPEIEVGSYLKITGSGLAVRAGPGTNHPLVSEFLLGREEPIETTLLRDEVRLLAGHVVQASLEPIIVDETAWVAVDNVPQGGQAREETPIWRSVAPVPHSEIDFQLTWIAVAQPGTTFVELTDQPACSSCYGDLPIPVAVASGVGDGRIGPWSNRDLAWITIAAASPSSSSTCEFHYRSQVGEPTFVNDPVDYFEAFFPGVGPALTASPDGDMWLDIIGDCAWAAKVYVAQG